MQSSRKINTKKTNQAQYTVDLSSGIFLHDELMMTKYMLLFDKCQQCLKRIKRTVNTGSEQQD